jgi:hypothetical protein
MSAAAVASVTAAHLVVKKENTDDKIAGASAVVNLDYKEPR